VKEDCKIMEFLRATDQPPFTSAHRGYSTTAPENTIAALEAAWKAGATVAEIDVRMTRDGELVLMHDRALDRTTSGNGPVSEWTLADLKRLDAGGWFNTAYAGEPIPRLDEVIAWAKGKIGLLVELKNFPERDPRYIPRVVDTFRSLDAAGEAAIASFDHRVLAEIHAIEPAWPLEMIYNARLADPVGAARGCAASLVSLEPDFCLPEDVAALHDAGISVLTTAWSVDHALVLHAMGVDFIEADDVDILQRATARIHSGIGAHD
jgi:glycerophosphoryl diester phosphodiesterase